MVRLLSSYLAISAMNKMFPRKSAQVLTRMNESLNFETFDRTTKVVVVDLMRAGILPSQMVFERLHEILPAENIRQDHILLNRKLNDKEEVIGVTMSGHKIGGPIQDSFVIFPDPMAATGSSIESVIKLYKEMSLGRARKFLALHFIITPEYLKRIQPLAGELEVFALRLDKGLNEKHYILPGAGGIGEILNNSFV